MTIAADRMPMNHDLKCDQLYFQDVWEGKKTWTLRKCDRDFQELDRLTLREWTGRGFTGRNIQTYVTYIFTDTRYGGLHPDFCILGFATDGLMIRNEARP